MLLKKIPLIDGLRVDEAHKGGGGKGGSAPAPQPIVQPAPAVQEASVEIGAEDNELDKKQRLKTGKSSLKLPLADTASTGLKV